MLFVAAVFLISMLQATTVTIGDLYSSSTTTYFPINCCYNYSYSQQIYTQSQINHAGEITRLRFNYSSGTASNSSNWTIYLGHTTRTNYPGTSSSYWIPSSAMTQVFSGTVTIPSTAGWMEVVLSTPFVYNNVDNLVLAVDENQPGYSPGYVRWQGFSSSLNAGIYHYSDTVNANPASPPNATNTNAFLSELQIVFANTDPPDPAHTPFPANLAANADARSILSWQAGVIEPTSYDLYFGTSNPPSYIGNQTGTTYNPGLMDYETTYYWQVIPRNSYGEASECPIWSFTTWPDPTIYSFPYNEGFNNTLFPPLGWKHTIVSGNYGFQRTSGAGSRPTLSSSFEGAGRMYYPGYALSGDANAWIATPEIAMQDTTKQYQVKLAFWIDSTAVASGSLDRIELYLNSSQNLSGSPTLIGTVHRTKSIIPIETGPDGWYQYLFDLGRGTGVSKYLIIKAINATYNGYGNGMNIDQVEILEHSALAAPMQAVSPRPMQNAVNTSVRPSLRWENGGGLVSGYLLYFGTSPETMQLIAEQSSTNFTFGSNLLWNTQYYWRVDALNASGTTIGEQWQFTTESVSLQLSSPANNATGVALNSILNWQDVPNATGYLISVGTASGTWDIADRISCQESQWSLGANWLFASSYFWKVTAINGSQEMEGAIWSFSTPSGQAVVTSPTTGQTQVNLEALLQWQAVNGATGYLIDVGTLPGITDIAERVACSEPMWDNPVPYLYATTYYWRVYVLNGTQEISGSQWSFSTIPISWGTPSPADNAINIAITTAFDWPDIQYVNTYKIKVGTTSGAGDVADMELCSSSQWTPESNLLFGQTYYWTVYAVNGTNEHPSSQWSFSTPSGQAVITSPTNRQTQVSLDAVLQWQAVPNATGYLIDVGTTEGATDIAERIACSEPVWDNPELWLFSSTYYWRVYVQNGAQEIPGSVWSFSTLPVSFGTPSPANNATNVSIATVFNWPDVQYVSAYKIKVGTSSGAGDVADMQLCNESQWTPDSNLLYGQTYYWTVYAINGGNEHPGTEWSFATRNGLATTPSPANNGTNISVFSKVLTWTAVPNASGYEVTAGTSPGASDLVDAVVVSTNRYTHPVYWPASSSVYWKVNTLNGAQLVQGTQWSFSTNAVSPLPYSQNFDASLNLPSGWSGNLYVSSTHGANGTNGLYEYLINFNTKRVTTGLIGPLTNNVILEFDYRFMAFNGYPANAYTLLQNQFLLVEVSNNDGSSYNILHQIDRTNHTPTTAFTTCAINLNQSGFVTSGNLIRLSFFCYSTSGIFYIDIDNVKLTPTLYAPTSISPSNNSTGQSLISTIDWSDVDLATSYRINVGTSPGATDIANQVECMDSQWSFHTGWSYNQTYYWQLTSVNDEAEFIGPEWSFSTQSDPNNINGYSLNLSGSSQYVNCGNPPAFNNLGGLTLEAWIYPTNFQDGVHKNTIIAKDFWGAGYNEGFAFRYGSSNRTLSFVMSNGTYGWNEVTAAGVLSLNTWQHVAATYNGSYMKIYVNGIQVGSLARSGSIPPSARNLLIGNSPASARYMYGYIDEARIWNVARSQTEISNNQYSDLVGQPNLIAYYKMTNGNGSLLSDNSGNANTATLINNPVWSYEVPIISLSAPQVVIEQDSTPGYIKLSWQAVQGATWYAVYMAETPGDSFGIGERSPDYVSNGLSIIVPITHTKRFFKVTAGVGSQPN
jgi:hypothetical protein